MRTSRVKFVCCACVRRVHELACTAPPLSQFYIAIFLRYVVVRCVSSSTKAVTFDARHARPRRHLTSRDASSQFAQRAGFRRIHCKSTHMYHSRADKRTSTHASHSMLLMHSWGRSLVACLVACLVASDGYCKLIWWSWCPRRTCPNPRGQG